MSDLTPPPAPLPAAPVPYPPPYRWTKRLIKFYLLLLLLLASAYTTWWLYARHVLAAQVAAIRARGEPLTEDDYKFPLDQPEQNSAPIWRLAAADLHLSRSEQIFVGDQGRHLLTLPSEQSRMDELLAGESAALADIRRAAALPHAIWGGPVLTAPGTNPAVPFIELRRLLQFLCAAAFRAHQLGRDDDALNYCDDAQALSHALGQQSSYISYHMAASFDTSSVATLHEIYSSLAISDRGGNARPATVRRLITRLLDDQDYRARSIAMEQYNRAFTYQVLTNSPRGFVGTFLPSFDLSIARLLRLGTRIVELAAGETFPQTQAHAHDFFDLDHNNLASDIALEAMPAANYLTVDFLINFRALADHRMAAVALAIKLYQTDHNQNRPTTLTQLVPNYIPAVPIDPFSAKKLPLQYAPSLNPPRLYSVNDNGTDDHGAVGYEYPSPSPRYVDFDDLSRSSAPDYPFFLDRVPGFGFGIPPTTNPAP